MPPEMLLTVFSYLVPIIGPAPGWHGTLEHPQRCNKIHPMMAASQVCRQWRDIAIGSPGLWRTILLPQDLNLIPILLTLSRPLSIDLEVIYGLPLVPAGEERIKLNRFLGLLLQEPERVRSVHLRGMYGRDYLSCKLLKARLVNLQNVSLEFEEDRRIERDLQLSDIGFSSEARVNLQQLSLIGGEWVPLRFQKLKHLFMFDCQIYGLSGYDSFLDTLEGISQTLETLYLVQCGPAYADDRTEAISYPIRSPQQRIPMSLLRSIDILVLEGGNGLRHHFLHNLTIPAYAKITWELGITRFDSGSEMEKYELPPPDCLSHVTRILVGGDDGGEVGNFVLDQQRGILVLPDSPYFHPEPNTGYGHVVVRLPKYLPNLTTVYFYEVDSFYNIYECLFHCHSVTTIVASVTSCDRVAKTLAALETNQVFDMDKEGSGHDAVMIVPALISLTIYTGPLNFAKERVRRRITKAINKSGIPIPILTINVPQERERAQAGKIYTLEFKSGDLDDHDAEFDFPFPRQAPARHRR